MTYDTRLRAMELAVEWSNRIWPHYPPKDALSVEEALTTLASRIYNFLIEE